MPTALVLPELRPWVWPFLTDYQRQGIVKAIARSNLNFWWACGAGKTLSALVWAIAVRGPVVVITKAAARRQWANEVRRFTTVDPHVILPVGSQRAGYEDLGAYLKRIRANKQRALVLVAWDALRDDETYLNLCALVDPTDAGGGSGSIVADEIHNAKDHRRFTPLPQQDGSMQFEERKTAAARGSFLMRTAKRRLGLTATPMPDRPRDLWAQLDAVDPGCMGKYWDYAVQFCNAHRGAYGMVDDGASNAVLLRETVAPRVHIVRSEAVYKLLPPVRRMTTILSADMLGTASAASSREVKRAAKEAHGGTGTEGGEAAGNLLEARLMETASMKKRHVVEHAAELLRAKQKVLIFTARRRDVASIEKALRRKTAKMQGLALWAADGGTPAEEREGIREEYMAHPGPACIVGTGAAWGESLNLHDTDRLVVVLLPWTWGQIRQWEGRVRRLGMQRSCIIEYLIAEGTIDERIANIVLGKLAAVEAILPDEQLQGVRETVQGGTDEEVIDGLLDRLLED